MAPTHKKVFVTVGSTLFDAMVSEVCQPDTLQVLAEKGFTWITMQIGRGKLPKTLLPKPSEDSSADERLREYLRRLNDGDEVTFTQAVNTKNMPGSSVGEGDKTSCSLTFVVFRFKPSIAGEMSSADLVVSHAGAGSSLEALSLHKPLVTVINDLLMDQHQSELAEEFALLGYSVSCIPVTLKTTLQEFDEGALKEYVPGQPSKFKDYLRSVFVVRVD